MGPDDPRRRGPVTELSTLSRIEAEELTARLRTSAAEFFGLLEQAARGGVHLAMGYKTFRAYLNGEFPGFTPPRIDRAARNAVIRGLLDAGLSTRDAAAATGVVQQTVRNSVTKNSHLGAEDDAIVVGEDADGGDSAIPEPAPANSHGIDKVARSLEATRRRLEDGESTAEIQLVRAIECLQGLVFGDGTVKSNYLNLMHALIELGSCVKDVAA